MGPICYYREMLTECFMSEFDVSERHAIVVHAPVEQIYAALWQADLAAARIARMLLALRGLALILRHETAAPRMTRFTLRDFLGAGFVLLGEQPGRELVLGVAGRFWAVRGDLQRLDARGFVRFDRPGYAKAVWNFSLLPLGENSTLLATETRVQALDARSRHHFLRYWQVIGWGSALIRRLMLRTIKRVAEGHGQ